MDEDAVIRIASMVKVAIVAGLRRSVKAGEDINQIIDRYEYATFGMRDGELVMVSAKKSSEIDSNNLTQT